MPVQVAHSVAGIMALIKGRSYPLSKFNQLVRSNDEGSTKRGQGQPYEYLQTARLKCKQRAVHIVE